jgi:hypothetical protein
MKSTVELDINAPQAQLAELFADPRNNTGWMDDVERIEPVSGELGEPGSTTGSCRRRERWSSSQRLSDESCRRR